MMQTRAGAWWLPGRPILAQGRSASRRGGGALIFGPAHTAFGEIADAPAGRPTGRPYTGGWGLTSARQVSAYRLRGACGRSSRATHGSPHTHKVKEYLMTHSKCYRVPTGTNKEK